MSNAGRSYVEKNSPYTGSLYWIHYKFGDIENETYGHRLFISEENIAAVCRIDVRTVRRAKKKMIEDGFLRLVRPAVGRRVAEYEFLFPDTSVEIVLKTVSDDDEIVGHFIPNSRTSHPDSRTSHPVLENTPYIRTKENEKGTEDSSSPDKSGDGGFLEPVVKSAPQPYQDEFEQVWKLYPRKIGKAAAYKMFVARIRSGVSPAELLQATENYADTRRGEPDTYTMHGSTFFGSSLRYQDFLDNGVALNETIAPTEKPHGAMSAIENFLKRRSE